MNIQENESKYIFTGKGKTGLYSLAPDQAIQWLVDHKNAFTVYSYFLFKKNHKKYLFIQQLEENELLISHKDVKIKPKLTKAQFKRILHWLEHYGFIEIKVFKPKYRVFSGNVKIELLVNIYDKKIIENAEKNHQLNGGYFNI